MDLKEAAVLLGWSRDSVLDAINVGVKLPKSGSTLRLGASKSEKTWELSDDQLQVFVGAFEAEEPGRHPPIRVRRELRTEARHQCAICRRDLPLQFHHILEWAELRHHDPHHMLAICGGCHDKIGVGQIDRAEQRTYKRKLEDELDRLAGQEGTNQIFPKGTASPLSWDTLNEVIGIVHGAVVGPETTDKSKFDFSLAELEEKNRLNQLGADTFVVMREHDEPFFGRIHSFLENPRNGDTTTLYYEIVDEFRRRIAAQQAEIARFENILNELYDVVNERFGEILAGKRRTLRIFLSFMYFNCDIGRKP